MIFIRLFLYLSAMAENRIHPADFARFGNLELLAKQVVEGFITGLHKSPFHGFSVEFAEHRLYNTGESTRNIDWKLYARTEKLFVKKYEEETNLRCRIIVDASSSMYFPEPDSAHPERLQKIGFSVFAAASIIEMLRRQRDAVGLTVYTDSVKLQSQVKSNSSHIRNLYRELELLYFSKAPVQSPTRTIDVLHHLAETIHRRSLVILFSDMFSPAAGNEAYLQELTQALRHLKHNRHEIIVFHVTAHQRELEFDYPNRPYRFIDLENGEELKLMPAEVREAYREASANFEHSIRLACARYGIDFIEADTDQGFHKILSAFMARRVKML